MIRLIKRNPLQIQLGLLVINLLALGPLTHESSNKELRVQDTMAGDRERGVGVDLEGLTNSSG